MTDADRSAPDRSAGDLLARALNLWAVWLKKKVSRPQGMCSYNFQLTNKQVVNYHPLLVRDFH